MRIPRLLPLLAAVCVAGAIPGLAKDRPDPAGLWKKSCSTCHAVPDPGLRADRAWIDQVRRTA